MPESAVIIPSFNRPEQLAHCLEALSAQHVHDYEIVVVDDGSPKPLDEICKAFPKVRYVRQDNSGPGAARNRGARETRARFLAFTDDDCRPRPHWLSTLMAAHGGHDKRLVGGRVVNGLPENPYSAASQMLCDYLYDYFEAPGGRMPFFTSNNMGMSRAGFERIGGFDESFGRAAAEDRDFGLRWRVAGGTLVYSDGAVVEHFHCLTLAGFWRQHMHYGAGARHLHRNIANLKLAQPRLEPLRFYTGLLTWPLARRGLRGLPLSLLMGLSQAAMVAGYAFAEDKARSSEHRGRRHVP